MLRRLIGLRGRGEDGRGAEASAESPNGANASSEDPIQALVEMGFEREQAEVALQTAGGDVLEAVVALVNDAPGASAAAAAAMPAEAGNAANATVDSEEELDALLNEALRISEQEAEAEKMRQCEEQQNLDAALVASLSCMGLESSTLTGLFPPPPRDGPAPPPPPGTAPIRSPRGVSQVPPHTARSGDRAATFQQERRRSPAVTPKAPRPLDDSELCDKVLGASLRRRHHKESPLHGFDGLNTGSSLRLGGGKQLLPPLQGRQPALPAPTTAEKETPPEPSRRRHSSVKGGSGHAAQDVVNLDDVDDWTRNIQPRQASQSYSGSPRSVATGSGSASHTGGFGTSGNLRPPSRGPVGGGFGASGNLRPPSRGPTGSHISHRGGGLGASGPLRAPTSVTGGSSSGTALRAAAALSIN